MTKYNIQSLIFIALTCTTAAMGQTAFQNLNFESPILPLVRDGNGFVPAAKALPGWSPYVGTNQQGLVLYSNYFLGTAIVALEGTPNPYAPSLQGTYSVLLQAGIQLFGPTNFVYANASISQVGLVPPDARSLQFKVLGLNFEASLAGQQIPLVRLGDGPGYEIYGGDISAFQGQMAELRLSALSLPTQRFVSVFLDDIVFSNLEIPEPNVIGLSVFGTFLLYRQSLQRHRHKPRRDGCDGQK